MRPIRHIPAFEIGTPRYAYISSTREMADSAGLSTCTGFGCASALGARKETVVATSDREESSSSSENHDATGEGDTEGLHDDDDAARREAGRRDEGSSARRSIHPSSGSSSPNPKPEEVTRR